MKLIVNDGVERKVNLTVPTWLILNKMTVSFLSDFLQRNGVTVTREQMKLFVAEIRTYKKQHGNLTLLEVKSKTGEEVTIIL